ncbi:MAG TPA: ZIP family metal transporter [Clostridiaceae bacterium]
MTSYMILTLLFGSILSLFGTLLGASLAIFLKNPSKEVIAGLLGFSAGLMVTIALFELVPEAIIRWNLVSCILFSFLAIGIMSILDKLIKFPSYSANSSMKVAFMAAIGIMLHNFPEGILMGAGFAQGSTLGIEMSILIAIHDIPEGLAVVAPLLSSKLTNIKIMLFVFITVLPTTIGTFIGVYMGGISDKYTAIASAIAAGIMCFVALMEMLPESFRLSKNRFLNVFSFLIGIGFGLVIIAIL